jgi:Rod binding domain-containing protein
MMDMAEQQLADMLGAQGGLGIAQMVVTQLGPKS